MFRFFVDQKIDDHFLLNKATLHHMQVARINNKSFICIHENIFYECKLVDNKAQIIKKLEQNHELSFQVVIAMAIIDTKRFEWMIQKATELGVNAIIPLISHNVVKKTTNFDKKLFRWQEIAKNAAEQSFRNKIPQIHPLTSFDKVLTIYPQLKKYIAHEKDRSTTPSSFAEDALFLVGPEGGFTDQEFEKAKKASFIPLSLGKRILRAETAPLFILSRFK